MNRFEALGLKESIVKAVTSLGFENPTPIQEQAIPQLLTGTEDLMALAQTGTGKTAAFGLPLAQLVDFTQKQVKALVLCPTRELCLQITKDIKEFTKYSGNANIVAIYGGASIQMQEREIRRGAQIVVGTPGRMVDMIDRGIVDLSQVRYAVLDEADEMLNMGFQEDLDKILKKTPATKNTWLFSATMPQEVLRISRKYMKEPAEITVGKRNEGAANIEHQYYIVHAKDKYQALKRIADYNPDIFAIVFCRTRIETQEVAEHLIKDGYNADSLHGDLSQAQRDHVMKRYRSKTLQMLVATDVAARGIDVDDVTHVINYNLPDEIENYTHRSGRTARAGKSGVSIAIVNMKEVGKIRMIERIINKKFTRLAIPTGEQVCEKQLFHLVKKIHNAEVDETGIAKYIPSIMEELKDLTKEELIIRFVSDEFSRFLLYYKNARDLNADMRDVQSGPRGKRLFINLGRMDGLTNETLKEYIKTVINLPGEGVLQTDVKGSFSFFEIDSKMADAVMAAFRNQEFNGRSVKIEFSSRENGGGGGGGERSYRGGGNRGGGGYGHKRSYEGGGGYKKSYEHSYSKKTSYDKGGDSDGNRSGGGERREKFKRPRKQF